MNFFSSFGLLLLVAYGCNCVTTDRLSLRLTLLSERLDGEILTSRAEAKLLKEKVKYIQEKMNSSTNDIAKESKEVVEEESMLRKYDNFASVIRKAFADEKRLNDRVRRHVADIEASVNGIIMDQMKTSENISQYVQVLREEHKETNRKLMICDKEMKNLNEQIIHISEQLNTVLNEVRQVPSKSEVQKLNKEIESLSQNVNIISDQIKIDSEKINTLADFVVNFKSCQNLLLSGRTESGVYEIYPDGGNEAAIKVYCDQVTDGGGWIVIQRRMDGTVDFYRDWIDYKNGFGNVEDEFWLGNEKIRQLTRTQNRELRIDMSSFENEKRFAKYSKFAIGSESENYALLVEGYSGDAYDSLWYHNTYPFSTKDRDNDAHYSDHCAVKYRGAWWYRKCINSNLNGRYLHEKLHDVEGIMWYLWSKYSLKFAEMKIR